MKNEFFNLIGQKSVNGKMILIAVVPDDLFGVGEMPNIFQCTCVRTVPNVFTGTYPTIRIFTETIKERKDLIGEGVAGIVTGENWFNESQEDKNEYGINL